MSRNYWSLGFFFLFCFIGIYGYYLFWIPFYYVLLALATFFILLSLSDFSLIKKYRFIFIILGVINLSYFSYKLLVSHEKITKRHPVEPLPFNLGLIQGRLWDQVQNIKIKTITEDWEFYKNKNQWWVQTAQFQDWASESELKSLWNLWTQSEVTPLTDSEATRLDLSWDRPRMVVRVQYRDQNEDTFNISYFRGKNQQYYLQMNRQYYEALKVWDLFILKKPQDYRSHLILSRENSPQFMTLSWGSYHYKVPLQGDKTKWDSKKVEIYYNSLKVLSARAIVATPTYKPAQIFIQVQIDSEPPLSFYKIGDEFFLHHPKRKVWMLMDNEVAQMRWPMEAFQRQEE